MLGTVGPKKSSYRHQVLIRRFPKQLLSMLLRVGAKSNPYHVTCATDFCNACNTIHDEAVLKEVAERFPQLFPFVNWAYAVPAKSWLNGGPHVYELL
jgi:hypothetical protein